MYLYCHLKIQEVALNNRLQRNIITAAKYWQFSDCFLYQERDRLSLLQSQNHRFELEGAIKGHLVQLPSNEQRHLWLDQVLRAPSSLVLNVSKDRASTTSLGNLCQCFTTFTIKKLIPYPV